MNSHIICTRVFHGEPLQSLGRPVLLFREDQGFALLPGDGKKERALNAILNLGGEGPLALSVAISARDLPAKAAGAPPSVDAIESQSNCRLADSDLRDIYAPGLAPAIHELPAIRFLSHTVVETMSLNDFQELHTYIII